jgi:CheY-like chemotaxis protein
MNCPRCRGVLPAPDAAGFVTCSSCGAHLRVRPAPGASAAPSPSAPGRETTERAGSPSRPVIDPRATLPPGTPLHPIPSPPGPAASAAATIETILAELHALRATQEEILGLLRASGPSSPAAAPLGDGVSFDDEAPRPAPAPIRTRRRKSVVLIDDDEETRKAAVVALERAEVPVRAVTDGNAALAAIAEDKPDVIIIELDIGGTMGGKDVINMIKATMEWVDIPIVLYTRLPIESQREARQIHGADELVNKGPTSAEALLARTIALFRRG